MKCNKKEDVKLNTPEEVVEETHEDASDCVEETAQEPSGKSSSKGVSRRGLISGAAAAVIVGAGGAVAVPLLSHAENGDSNPATKDDISKLEYELSMLKNVSDDAELISHKSTKIDETSTDVQYPSSKAVYDALTDKIDINQGEEKAGYIFVVNEAGKLELSKFTSDTLSDTETLPVENKTIYKELKDIMKALNDLDEVPNENSVKGVESGGVYKTYQQTKEITTFTDGDKDLQMGVNYKYTGKDVTDSDSDETFAIRKFDNVWMAISETDPSVVYTSVNQGKTWGAPYGGW